MPQKVLPVSEVEVDSVHRSSANQSKLQATLNSQIERIKSTVPARFVEKADQVLLGLSHTGQSSTSALTLGMGALQTCSINSDGDFPS